LNKQTACLAEDACGIPQEKQKQIIWNSKSNE
jgi:hypothetical protein